MARRDPGGNWLAIDPTARSVIVSESRRDTRNPYSQGTKTIRQDAAYVSSGSGEVPLGQIGTVFTMKIVLTG